MLLYFTGLIAYLITNPIQATSLSINVYLKLKPGNQVVLLIKDFNQFLQKTGLFHTDHIAPFIHQHPLHITLYLATYEQKQLAEIIKRTQWLAKQHQRIPISTHQFLASPNGYVMLSVRRTRRLQELGNQTLLSLAGLRDTTALIPKWAAENMERRALFTKWGSTSVMNFFQPHFSLFEPEYLTSKQQIRLYQRLQQLIDQFSKTHQVKVNAIAYAIGVGIADKQGQIVEELNTFELN